MAELPELGKIPPEFFDRVIFPHLGAKSKSVVVTPQHGVDFGAIEIGDQVLVMSSDPVFIAPSLGWERAAWFALHILASDVAVSGIRPSYLTIDLNLPPEMSADTLETIWTSIHREAEKLGISVVTGHTARYAGCAYPMVGGATIFGVGSKKELIVRNSKVGDKIIITKGPAVEATGLMSVQFPEFLEERYGSAFVKKAQDVFYQMTVVDDALTAAKVGGVTAMHDATECGVWGGLYEIAAASKVGMRIHKGDILLPDVIKQTCACFGMDPYKSISEGTLLATVSPEYADEVIRALERKDIPASIAGEIVPKKEGIRIVEGKKETPLEHPKVDPFWGCFEEYLKRQAQRVI